MRTKLSKGLAVSVFLMSASGCANLAFRSQSEGILYNNSTMTKLVTQSAVGPLQGKACANSVFGWFTWGDASAATAAKNANIVEITTVDEDNFSVLGLYAQTCTSVTGSQLAMDDRDDDNALPALSTPVAPANAAPQAMPASEQTPSAHAGTKSDRSNRSGHRNGH